MKKKIKGNEYWVSGSGIRGHKTIIAQNVQDAVNKAARLYPKAKFLTIGRKRSRSGREYETYGVIR